MPWLGSRGGAPEAVTELQRPWGAEGAPEAVGAVVVLHRPWLQGVAGGSIGCRGQWGAP